MNSSISNCDVIVTMDKHAKQLSCRRPNPYRPIIPNRGVTHVTGVTEIISGRKKGEGPEGTSR